MMRRATGKANFPRVNSCDYILCNPRCLPGAAPGIVHGHVMWACAPNLIFPSQRSYDIILYNTLACPGREFGKGLSKKRCQKNGVREGVSKKWCRKGGGKKWCRKNGVQKVASGLGYW